jgi:hypothetical protein
LRATLISTSALPRLRRASHVHSVFTHALNIVDPDGLITIADPTVGAVPSGIVLEAPTSFEQLVVRRGDAVACADELHIGDLVIALAGASAWSPVLAAQAVAAPHLVLETWHTARVRHGLPAQRARPIVRQLRQAHHDQDLPAMLNASRGLVGLGQGLTPAGDDVLIGFSAALWSADDPLATPFRGGFAEIAANRTTDVALVFYRSAARGEFSARLHAVFAALAEYRDPARLSLAFDRALDWGATSGADTLLGVMLGLFATLSPLEGRGLIQG